MAGGEAEGPERGAVAGDGVLHPAALIALAVLVWNDHMGKALYPGLITGKLSDVAGLFFFPLLCQGIAERLGLCRIGDRRWLAGAAVGTGLLFAAIKLHPGAAAAYRVGLGWAQCLPRMGWGWARADGAAGCAPVAMQMDATDLWALPMLGAAVWLGRGRGDSVGG